MVFKILVFKTFQLQSTKSSQTREERRRQEKQDIELFFFPILTFRLHTYFNLLKVIGSGGSHRFTIPLCIGDVGFQY